MGKFASRRLGRNSPVINKEFGCVCMESIQSSQGGPDFYYTLVKCIGHEIQEVDKNTCGSREGGSEEIEANRGYQEVFFPKWLSNMVVVKKKIGKWKVCVDFTDLN